MKMAEITPVLKLKTDYLPYKRLKRIMYNGIFCSLTENKVLFLKLLGLQKNTSTNHFKLSLKYY